MPKKKVRESAEGTIRDDLMTEEESKVLEEEFDEEGAPVEEPEDKDADKGKKKKKPKAGGKGDDDKDAEGEKSDDEDGEKEGEKEGEPKDEGEKDEGGDTGDKDTGEGDDKGGDDEDPLKDAKPVALEVDGEKVEGWLAKSGKYIISFKDVEKRDDARRTLREENETLKGMLEITKQQMTSLQTQINELKAGTGDTGTGDTQVTKPDFKGLAEKAYQSPEDMAEAFEAIFTAGQKVGAAAAGNQGAQEDTGQETGQMGGAAQTILTPQQIEANAKAKVALELGVEKIVEEFPKLNEPDMEFICFQKAMSTIQEKLNPLSEEARTAFLQNPESVLGVIREAASWTMGRAGGGTQTAPEQDAEREAAIRREVLQEIGGKLKLSEDEIRTLGDVTGGKGGAEGTKKELEDLDGPELEEAAFKMTDEQKDDFLKPDE